MKASCYARYPVHQGMSPGLIPCNLVDVRIVTLTFYLLPF